MMENEHVWKLIARCLQNEATAAERKELNSILSDNPSYFQQYELLTLVWQNKKSNSSSLGESNANDAIARILKKAEMVSDELTVKKITSQKIIWLAAASVLFIISISVIYFTISKKQAAPIVSNKVEYLQTPKGSRSKSLLPDGTSVWLNAGSKLELSQNFGKSFREVRLIGEAYFDVAKNKAIPFIIHTATIDIKVTGTSFNVKAYPEDKETVTSLIHGSIEVTLKNKKGEKVIMLPNDKLVVENKMINTEQVVQENNAAIKPEFFIQKLKNIETNASPTEIQWVENKLVFDNEPFSEIAAQMERWYNVEIEIKSEGLKNKRMTVNLTKENIDEALEALRYTKSFNVIRQGNKIFINP